MPKYQIEENGYWFAYDSETHAYYKITIEKVRPSALSDECLIKISDAIAADKESVDASHAD